VESRIMQDEIFGPVLPVLRFTDSDQVVDRIQVGEKPLAMYIFSNDPMTSTRS